MKKIVMAVIAGVVIALTACSEQACPTYNGGGDANYSYIDSNSTKLLKDKKAKVKPNRRSGRS